MLGAGLVPLRRAVGASRLEVVPVGLGQSSDAIVGLVERLVPGTRAEVRWYPVEMREEVVVEVPGKVSYSV